MSPIPEKRQEEDSVDTKYDVHSASFDNSIGELSPSEGGGKRKKKRDIRRKSGIAAAA